MKKSLFVVGIIAFFTLITSSAWANHHDSRHSNHGYRNHYPQRHAYYPPPQPRYWHSARPVHHKAKPLISIRDHGKRIRFNFR